MTCLTIRRFAARAAALVLVLTLGAGVAALPAVAEEPVRPNLTVTGRFDHRFYAPDNPIGVSVSIGNSDSGPATVHVVVDGNVVIPAEQWGDLAPDRPGVRLGPGERLFLELSGRLSGDGPVAWLNIVARPTEGDDNMSDNEARLQAPIGRNTGIGSYSGTVYVDRNDNRVADPDEGLSLVQVSLLGWDLPPDLRYRTTNAQGRFEFRNVPIGLYNVHFVLPGGWELRKSFGDPWVMIGENVDFDVPIRAYRPMSESVRVSLAFAKPAYAMGETAALRATLTNIGANALPDLAATCGDPADRTGGGEFGVALGLGETKTFTISTTISQDAAILGRQTASCVVGVGGTQSQVKAATSTRVLGLRGSMHSVLVYDRNKDGLYAGEGVPDTKVVLVDPDTGAVVARSVTDASGRFEFRDVPAGPYELRPIGPWKLVPGRLFQVFGGRDMDRSVDLVIPGPIQPDPDARPEETLAPQGDVSPAAEAAGAGRWTLAATGASPSGLIALGIAAVLLGTTLVFAGRRRREPS